MYAIVYSSISVYTYTHALGVKHACTVCFGTASIFVCIPDLKSTSKDPKLNRPQKPTETKMIAIKILKPKLKHILEAPGINPITKHFSQIP